MQEFKLPSWKALVSLGVLVAAGGCNTAGGDTTSTWNGPPKGPSRSHGEVHQQIDVAAETVDVGFAIGLIRKPKKLEAFSISKFPVTRGQYLDCVQAGACTKSETNRCIEAGPDRLEHPTVDDDAFPKDTPATCVGFEEARKYCHWARGSLPTLEQWLLAARGPSVSRYAWGGSGPTCEQHPKALKIEDKTPCELTDPAPVEVGKHSAGASPLGMEDVLLTRAELLQASKKATFGGCESPKEAGANGGGCLVYGMEPGAIDSVRQMPLATTAEDGKPSVEVSPAAYAFRCVWGEEESK